MAQKRLALIGAGELGCQLAHLIIEDKTYKLIGFFDDIIEIDNIFSLPILGNISEIEAKYRAGFFDVLLIAIGYKHLKFRESLFNRFYKLIPFATFIHSSCIIDSSAKVDAGSVLLPGCILNMKSHIGYNVLAYSGLILSHDSSIGNHSFIAPGVKIAGFSKIGCCNFIGIGTVISDNVSICDDSITGAGTVIVKSIGIPGKYIGTPARKIKL